MFVADVALEAPCSGSEQVLYNQALGLAHAGMKVYAITRQNGSNPTVYRTVDDCIEEACYSAPTGNVFNFFGSLFKETRKHYDFIAGSRPFDVAICHHPFAYSSLLVSGKLKNIPVIHVFH